MTQPDELDDLRRAQELRAMIAMPKSVAEIAEIQRLLVELGVPLDAAQALTLRAHTRGWIDGLIHNGLTEGRLMLDAQWRWDDSHGGS